MARRPQPKIPPSRVRGLDEQIAAKVAELGPGGSSDWGDIGGTLSDQTDLQAALDAKSPIASPTFTGTPAAPTASPGANTTQIATTAFVAAAVAALINSAPGALDTLDELAAALGDDANFAATITSALAGKQPLDSDLTALAALDSSLQSVILSEGAGWTRQTFAQFLSTIGVTPYLDEIVVARGSRNSINERISVISNFASPNAGGVVSGFFYDNSFQGTASSTVAGAANRCDLAPYYTSINLPIDQIGIACSTAVASAQAKIVIYDSDANGWPGELLYESGNLDLGTTGYKFASLTFTFQSGRQYWIGVRHSSTATIRTINVSSAVNLGVNGSNGSNYFTILRRTITYANAAPNPWTFVSTDLVANVTPPSIRFRAV